MQPLEYPSESQPKTELDEQRRKVGEDVVKRLEHLVERVENGLSLTDPRFSERYEEMELHILVHFRIRGSSEDYVALFEREQPLVLRRDEDILAPERERFIGVTASPNLPHVLQIFRRGTVHDGRTGSDQEAVFVNVVQLMESPERVVPTFVRFDRINRFYSFWPETLYFSQFSGFVFCGGVEDRKVQKMGGVYSIAGDKKQLIDEMIEGASRVVQNVSRDCGDFDGYVRDAAYIVEQLSRIRIMLGIDLIGVAGEKSGDFKLEITDVLFGPFHFYGDLSDSVVGWHQRNRNTICQPSILMPCT